MKKAIEVLAALLLLGVMSAGAQTENTDNALLDAVYAPYGPAAMDFPPASPEAMEIFKTNPEKFGFVNGAFGPIWVGL